jgi:hypothetical protein
MPLSTPVFDPKPTSSDTILASQEPDYVQCEHQQQQPLDGPCANLLEDLGRHFYKMLFQRRSLRVHSAFSKDYQGKLLLFFRDEFTLWIKIKVLGSECQTSGTYAKRAKQATKNKQLLEFSELPSFLRPAADRAVSILPWVVSPYRSYGFLWAVRLFKEM